MRVGITCDLIEHNGVVRAAAGVGYVERVVAAGGVPVLMAPTPGLEGAALDGVDALVLTGGDDPRTEAFGEPTHPAAVPVHADRQAFETALTRLAWERQVPTLGVCLGMQMMALVAGGRLHQHLPEVIETAELHRDAEHEVIPEAGFEGLLPRGVVRSKHHQAVAEAGGLSVLARAGDGVIEAVGAVGAVGRLDGRWWVGVQWHPERTGEAGLGARLFERLVGAAGGAAGMGAAKSR